MDAKALVPDKEPADEDLSQLFMSLVGALAWLILAMPSTCIYSPTCRDRPSHPTSGTTAVPTGCFDGSPQPEEVRGVL